MAGTHKKKILLLTLVHPDFLPPVYAVAQVLRDGGYDIHILTFDPYTPSGIEPGDHITLESAGKHHGIGLAARLKLRGQFTKRALQLANEGPVAIIAFCAFTYLCALKVRKGKPLIYHALEVSDFIWKEFGRSPLSHYNNLTVLNNIHKADLVATPSHQRSAWLAGRCHLGFLPETILNTAYIPKGQQADTYELFKKVVPAHLLDKKIVLYTGAVNEKLCIKELVQAFSHVNDPQSALVMTGMKDNAYCNEIKNIATTSPAKDRILLLPYVTRAEMLALQDHAHIGVCLQREYADNVETRMIAPNKAGEYLAKDLYLLATDNSYFLPIKMKGIASLAATPGVDDVSAALREALKVVADKTYKAAISTFVSEYFSMQQQLKPVLNFLKRY